MDNLIVVLFFPSSSFYNFTTTERVITASHRRIVPTNWKHFHWGCELTRAARFNHWTWQDKRLRNTRYIQRATNQQCHPAYLLGDVWEDRQGGGRGGVPQRGRGLPRRPRQQYWAISSGCIFIELIFFLYQCFKNYILNFGWALFFFWFKKTDFKVLKYLFLYQCFKKFIRYFVWALPYKKLKGRFLSSH